MTDEQPNKITINDKEYTLDDFDDKQKHLINQITSVNTKVYNLQFELEQMTGAKEFFISTLVASIEAEDPQTVVE